MKAPPAATRVVSLTSSSGRLPLKELGLTKGRPVIALAGTTADLEPELVARLYPFIRTITATAADHGAVIVTGGTDAGVIQLVGVSLASVPSPPTVVGVAPAALVARDGAPSLGEVQADPNQDALLLVPGSVWGDETPVLSRLVGEVADGEPTLLVVIGGGEGARLEVLQHGRERRPIVVLGRSGRLADDLAEQRLGVMTPGTAGPPVAARELYVIDLSESPSRLRAVLELLLRNATRRGPRQRFPILSVWPRARRGRGRSTLPFGLDAGQMYPQLHDGIVEGYREVYPFFAECDQTALREQRRYRAFVVAAIIGGFITTLFGAIQASLPLEWWPGVVVATVGASTTAVTTLARRQGALDAYLNARIRAERLRSLFVRHVATLPGVAPAERHGKLRALQQEVARIRFGQVKR